MSNDNASEPARPAPAPKVAPERLELRAQPRPVTRLSRRALIALGSGSSLVIGGLAIWALSVNHNGGKAPEELYSTDRKPVAEGLNTLPSDYAGVPAAPPPGVPQLGPPLPGDLGRPILSAGQQGTSPMGQTLNVVRTKCGSNSTIWAAGCASSWSVSSMRRWKTLRAVPSRCSRPTLKARKRFVLDSVIFFWLGTHD